MSIFAKCQLCAEKKHDSDAIGRCQRCGAAGCANHMKMCSLQKFYICVNCSKVGARISMLAKCKLFHSTFVCPFCLEILWIGDTPLTDFGNMVICEKHRIGGIVAPSDTRQSGSY